MRVSICASALGLLCLLPTVHGQGKLQITFDGSPTVPAGNDIAVRSYSERGMIFRPIKVPGGFGRVGPSYPADPQNGTAYLRAAFTDSLMFSSSDNSPFDLLAVDLGEYSTLFQEPLSIRFVGYKPDGSILNTVFVTDGIIDGTGPLADFETFYFGPQWSGLTRVEVPGWRWSLDNLVVSVPEPGTGALLFTGISLVFARRFHKRKL